jgi:hypothetical protein
MRKVCLGLLLAAAAATSWAQDGKGYVGVGAGTSRHDIDGCGSFFNCDDTGFAWNARAGYYILPWLGLEASYLDFGTSTVPGVLVNPPAGTVPIPTDSDNRAFGFVASLVGRIPLGPISVMGRVGYGAITGKFTGNAAVQNVQNGAITYFSAMSRDTTGQFVYGAGVAFDFTRSWTGRIDWDRTKAEDGLNPKFDVDMITGGVAYRF